MTTPPHSSRTHLQTLHLTLHHLNHRNKNQHRLAKWYRSLTQFLRQCQKLGEEVGEWDCARGVDPFFGGEGKKESRFTSAAREKLSARIGFLGRYMVGRWYLAFTTLTADNQYAALGLMLLGSLARFQTVIKQVAKEIDLVLDSDVEIPEVIHSQEVTSNLVLLRRKEDGHVDDLGEVVSREGFETSTLTLEGRAGDGDVVLKDEDEDDEPSARKKVNVKKTRKEVIEDIDGQKEDEEVKIIKKQRKRKDVEEASTGEIGESTSKVKKPKKKKKKGDAFDDLFGGLI